MCYGTYRYNVILGFGGGGGGGAGRARGVAKANFQRILNKFQFTCLCFTVLKDG